jgi:hypothetical protein
MDMVVANNTERLNEYKETNKITWGQTNPELNARISTIGEHSTKTVSTSQHKIQIDATPS